MYTNHVARKHITVNRAEANRFTLIVFMYYAPMVSASNTKFELCFLQRYTDPQDGKNAQQLSESNVGDQKVSVCP